MKKIVIGAVVVLVLGAMVAAALRGSRREKGTKVYVELVAQRDIGRLVKASGEIDPRVKVNISAHVVGKIERLYVEEGDSIKKGQPFLDLEKESFIAARDQWAASLRKAQTEVRQAEVNLADTRNKLARAERLSKEGILSSEQLEAAQLAEANAKLRLEDSRESVLQARANLEKVKDDLKKTTIYAPLTGRVIKLNAEEGEVVVSGTMNNAGSVIGEIADLSEILANVDVDETEVVLVKPGQDAVIKVDALPNKQYHGHVSEVGSKGFNRPAQPDVTFFDVEVLLDDPDEDLRPGMSVRAEINTAVHPNALVVPIQAVVERDIKDQKAGTTDEADVVYVVENGKAVQRKVETGISDETRVEVVAGVKTGEKVVTGPYRSLRDLEQGETVKVTTPDEEKKATKKKDSKDKDEDEDDEKDEKGEAKVEVD
ncbi:MAG TPA: efflux RND transporter periplasmic adaptor subunit [Thermoanaerobaculia bacterium]|nr:efflux RND transporter periplasmic adaptor subunit [Thermoanaerobaculia bacterium]